MTVTAKDKTVQDYSELQIFARNFEESDTGLELNSSSSCLVGVQEIAEFTYRHQINSHYLELQEIVKYLL